MHGCEQTRFRTLFFRTNRISGKIKQKTICSSVVRGKCRARGKVRRGAAQAESGKEGECGAK
jgi:hypothetical protein